MYLPSTRICLRDRQDVCASKFDRGKEKGYGIGCGVGAESAEQGVELPYRVVELHLEQFFVP